VSIAPRCTHDPASAGALSEAAHMHILFLPNNGRGLFVPGSGWNQCLACREQPDVLKKDEYAEAMLLLSVV